LGIEQENEKLLKMGVSDREIMAKKNTSSVSKFKVCVWLLKKWLIVLISMVKLILFTKIHLLIVVSRIVKFDEI